MFIIEILVPSFLLVWSIAFFLGYLYTRYLIDKYDRAVLPGCRISAQKYQWSSKQVWEDSFTLLSGLWLKFFCIFAPISLIIDSLWLFLKSFRLYISIAGGLFFLIFMLIFIIKGIKIHKSFCSKGWFWTSYNTNSFNDVSKT